MTFYVVFFLISLLSLTHSKETKAVPANIKPTKGFINFDKYFRYTEIQDYLKRLATQYPRLVTLENYGLSYEGRNLTAVYITSFSASGLGRKKQKPVIFVDAGIHAREWIAPAQALYLIDQLLESEKNIYLRNNADWVIIPLLNPDGYEYSHTTNRLWRKTRSKGKRCYGVDPNRNFNFFWGGMGASTDECSETYAGPEPFSEPETRALSNLISQKYQNKTKMYLTFHSAAQSFLHPWGYSIQEIVPNLKELRSLAIEARHAVKALNGTVYNVGTVGTIPANFTSGCSRDWVYAVTGIPLAYTVELPPAPGNRNKFVMPPHQISTVVQEMLEAVKIFHRYVIQNYLKRLATDYPRTVTLENYGLSYEGRNLTSLFIHGGVKVNKPIIFVDAGIHAREWIAPAQALYLIDQLLESEENTYLKNDVDWVIVPLLNPDGYEFSHTNDRMWRKTRSKGKECYGVDPNRNFNHFWGGMGSSTDECSQTYAGPKPFSEPETLALSKLISQKYRSKIKMYLTFHSPAQSFVHPWGYSQIEVVPNLRELKALALDAKKAIEDTNGTVYGVGSVGTVGTVSTFGNKEISFTSGCSRDWVYGVTRIPLAYTVELPPGDINIFVMPASRISKVVKEMLVGVKIFHRYVANKFFRSY